VASHRVIAVLLAVLLALALAVGVEVVAGTVVLVTRHRVIAVLAVLLALALAVGVEVVAVAIVAVAIVAVAIVVMALVVLVTRRRVIAVLAVENPQLKVVIRLSIILSFFRLGLHSSAGFDSIVGSNRKYYSIPRVALVNQCDSSGSYR
jgi:hypothetical protein